MRIATGSTDKKLPFVAVDSTDLKTRETGLTGFTVYRSRDGGTATLWTTPTIAEASASNMPGLYWLTVDEDTTITSGDDEETVTLHITCAGMDPVTITYELFRPKGTEGNSIDISAGGEVGLDWANIGSPTTSQTLSGTTVGTATAVTTVNGLAASVITAASIAADAITASKIADGAIDAATLATGTITAAKFAAGAIDAAAIADGAIDAATLATGTITAAKFAAGAIDAAAIADNAIDAGALAADCITAAKIAAGAIDTATFAADVGFASLRSNTATAGAASTVTLDASATTTVDFYKGCMIVLTGGTGAGQARFINAYSAGRVATVDTAWVTQPVNGTTFAILPADNASPATRIALLQTDTDDIQTRLPAALGANGNMKADVRDYNGVAGTFASGRPSVDVNSLAASSITATSIATGAITAAKFAAGAIDAAALATDAAAEIAAAVWDLDATAHQTQGTFGQAIGDPVADTNTIFKAVVTDATGATVGIDVVAVKAETASIQSDTDNIQTRLPTSLVSGRIDASVGAMAANVLTASAINADAITAAKVAADVGTEIATAVWGADAGDINIPGTAGAALSTTGPTAAVIADAVWDELLSGHTTTGSAGKALSDAGVGGTPPTVAEIADGVWDELLSGHAVGGSAGAALTGAGSAGDPWTTLLPGAYGAGTAGKIVGDNLNATVSSRATQTSLDAVDDLLDTEIAAIKAETASIQSDTNDIQTRLPAALVSGRMDSSVGSMVANTVNASALASDALNEIMLAIWGADSGDINLPGTAGAALSATGPTAAAIADAVWDELLSGHAISGSAGAGLTAAGTAGDPWSTLLPGSYGTGTAGKLIGDSLDAAVSTRASQSSVSGIGTDVDALPSASAIAAAVLSAASFAPIASDLKSIKTVPLTGTGPFGI